MLPLQARVDQGSMAMKEYSTFPQSSPLYLGNLLGKSYPAAEIQSVYSAAPANWAYFYMALGIDFCNIWCFQMASCFGCFHILSSHLGFSIAWYFVCFLKTCSLGCSDMGS